MHYSSLRRVPRLLNSTLQDPRAMMTTMSLSTSSPALARRSMPTRSVTRTAHCARVVAPTASKTPIAAVALTANLFIAELAIAASDVIVDATTSAEASGTLAKDPALLGFACVAVCWGIPQTVGMMMLEKKETRGRELLEAAGVDTSDVGKGNWGRIRSLMKENGIEMTKE